jgi:hypothetical protein
VEVEVEQMKLFLQHSQHFLAVSGTVVALFASIFQGRRAKIKSTKSKEHQDVLSREEGASETLKSILEDDIKHFKKVGGLWYVFVVGASVAVVAEGLDWLGLGLGWW